MSDKNRIMQRLVWLEGNINCFMTKPAEYKEKEDEILIDFERFTTLEKKSITDFKVKKMKEIEDFVNQIDFDKQQKRNDELIKERDFLEIEMSKLYTHTKS